MRRKKQAIWGGFPSLDTLVITSDFFYEGFKGFKALWYMVLNLFRK
jgi:hypothetical protein